MLKKGEFMGRMLTGSHPSSATLGRHHTPHTKDRALSLRTLTHFSINGFLNASHTWNKPLTTGPPKPGVTHPQSQPSFSGMLQEQLHHCGVSKQPGIPGLAPAGGKPSPAEHTHPNSGANTATLLAGSQGAAFSQRPAQGQAGGASNLQGVFPSLPQPVHGRTAPAAGAILGARHPPASGCPPSPQPPNA